MVYRSDEERAERMLKRAAVTHERAAAVHREAAESSRVRAIRSEQNVSWSLPRRRRPEPRSLGIAGISSTEFPLQTLRERSPTAPNARSGAVLAGPLGHRFEHDCHSTTLY